MKRLIILGLFALIIPSVLAAAPEITLNITTTNDTYALINVTADQAVDTWWYSLDGGANTTFTPNMTLYNLSNGVHTITVYANNSGGEIGSTDHYDVPTTEWTLRLGHLNHANYGRDVLQTNDGGFVLTGSTHDTNMDMWLVKLNASGDHQWNVSYPYGNDNDYGISLKGTPDGGFIVAGYANSPTDMYVVKTNSTGGHEWNNTYGGGSSDLAWSIINTSSGGYLIAGHTESFGAGADDAYYVKINSTGGTEWTQTFGTGGNDQSADIIEINGSYLSVGHINTSQFILVLNSTGGIVWNKTYDVFDFSAVRETTDGGYIISGSLYGGIVDRDYLLMKVNSTGDQEWNNSWGGTNTDESQAVGLAPGGYFIFGSSISYGPGGDDYWIIKTNSTGGQQWNATYGAPKPFIAGSEYGFAAKTTNDGGYILNGHTDNTTDGFPKMYVVKLGSDLTATSFSVNDTVPPNITMTSPKNGSTYEFPVAITATADEPIATWQYSLNGAANVTFTPTISLTLVDGDYNITVYATDLAGNVGSRSVSFSMDNFEFAGDSPLGLPYVEQVLPEPAPDVQTISSGDRNYEATVRTDGEKITVRLENIVLTMPPETFVLLDLDEDGVNDVRVETKGFVDGVPEVIITELKEEVKASEVVVEPVIEETTEEPTQEVEPELEEQQVQQITQPAMNFWPALIVFGILAALIAAFVVILRRRE